MSYVLSSNNEEKGSLGHVQTASVQGTKQIFIIHCISQNGKPLSMQPFKQIALRNKFAYVDRNHIHAEKRHSPYFSYIHRSDIQSRIDDVRRAGLAPSSMGKHFHEHPLRKRYLSQ